jgi:hypothetical protein
MNKVSPLLLAGLLLCGSEAARALSSCSSDGVPRPTALLERFINADCESCWRDAEAPKPARRELALDWIVPGSRGEDAPLSAAASRDASARLDALARKLPTGSDSHRGKSQAADVKLRVAHGPAFNDYTGVSIELGARGAGPWQAWLLLVETLPAGTEGSPVERNLVRNALQVIWAAPPSASKEKQLRSFESRPMRIPEGARADRLRVVGWVQDDQGRIRAIAQSRCAPGGG